MKKNPSVTILLTTKNDERTIEKCVKSLLKQTYKNYKIYITEAYSTDKTYYILEKLKKKYPRKIKLERIKANRPKAYNHMLRKVKTNLVAFTDGDAVVDRKWLSILIKSFEKDVVAVGGTIKNPPKGLNYLQKLIGKELEYRFENLPKYVSRLPTMNLIVKTKYAKKCKFNEKLRVAQETEWGYQLNKYGKIKFEPNAIVWHYHRASLKGYIKQQFLYGANVPKVYLSKANISKISGDEISSSLFVYQIIFLGLCGLLLLFSYNIKILFDVFSIFLIFLFITYFLNAVRITVDIVDIITLIILFFIRNICWLIGILYGIVLMVIKG